MFSTSYTRYYDVGHVRFNIEIGACILDVYVAEPAPVINECI